jgi:hypothetical protein
MIASAAVVNGIFRFAALVFPNGLNRRSERQSPRAPAQRCMLTSLLKEEIEKINPRDKEKRTWMELVVLATIKLAIKGHPAVLREVWDRVDGKVRQDVGIEMDTHNEIVARLNAARERLARLRRDDRETRKVSE